MKTLKLNLLAAILALPLLTVAGAARAEDANVAPPPAQGEGPDGGPQHDGPGSPQRGGPEGGPGFGPGPGPGFGPAFGPGFGPGRPPFFRGVELSEAQQDKVFAILHAEAPYLRDQAKAAGKAREALRALAGADKYDDAKAAALAKEAATADANIVLQHIRTRQKLLAVLTPEQRKQQAEEQPRHPQRP
ncbi:Spy/CpxP family protein refolding chaperone [Duganella sp. P38]|uniref:Spy/CpxP family protein refolding chaperone n=1 Tax=Duganella sp. P38 TaxID=3423949 RepID=UPI003D7AEED9